MTGRFRENDVMTGDEVENVGDRKGQRIGQKIIEVKFQEKKQAAIIDYRCCSSHPEVAIQLSSQAGSRRYLL